MKTKIPRGIATACAMVGLWAGASLSADAAVTHRVFTGTSGSLSAKATFDVVGNTLTILLENTSTADVNAAGQVLTALFWDPTANLTAVSAVVGAGSQVLENGVVVAGAGSAVGGEWAYKSGLNGAPGGAVLGISSSGLNLFGPGDLFPPGTDLQPPVSPDGVQYGIVSAGYTSAGDNQGLAGNGSNQDPQRLIKNSVLFTLNITGTYDLADVTNVSFQYGTSLDETNVPVPEPSTYIAGALLLIPLLVQFRRWKRAA